MFVYLVTYTVYVKWILFWIVSFALFLVSTVSTHRECTYIWVEVTPSLSAQVFLCPCLSTMFWAMRSPKRFVRGLALPQANLSWTCLKSPPSRGEMCILQQGSTHRLSDQVLILIFVFHRQKLVRVFHRHWRNVPRECMRRLNMMERESK